MNTISLKLSTDLDAKLAAVAKRRGTTKSAVVRAALKQYLEPTGAASPESFAVLAREFIGSASGGPPDLSYNKKHMEGYGRE
jgi:predicted DNA-binding protein